MPQPPDHIAVANPGPSEVEWQLDAEDLDGIERWLAVPRPRAGLRARSTGRKLIVDHYVDTPDLRLHNAGFAARLRGANGKAEATLKSIVSGGDPETGLRRRLELNEPIRHALLHSLAGARGSVGARIREHAAVRELRVLFTVRTDRRTAIVSDLDGADLGEVALDDTTIEAGDRTEAFRRIEVEALTPDAEALMPFVELLRDSHRLRPGTSSKFGRGLALAREAGFTDFELPELAMPVAIAAPAPASQGDRSPPAPLPEFDNEPAPAPTPRPLPDHSLAALVRDILSTQLAHVRDNEPGTRAGDDIEALHDMRVAVRRLRTALRLFAKVLPRVRGGTSNVPSVSAIDASLRWLAAELGTVRDLDVQIERIDEWQSALDDEDAGALDPLADLLRRRRDAARVAMVAAMDTPRLPALYRAIEALAAAGRDDLPRRALKPAVVVLPSILRKRYRAFRARARKIDGDERPQPALLHETRIRGKRLRYAAEFARPVYGKRARALVAALKDTQDVLGLHQDAEVAVAELRQISADAGADLPPRTLFAMGEIAQRYRDNQRELRLAVPEATATVRHRWRRLRRVMRAAASDRSEPA